MIYIISVVYPTNSKVIGVVNDVTLISAFISDYLKSDNSEYYSFNVEPLPFNTLCIKSTSGWS